MMFRLLMALCVLFFADSLSAQDTFYVRKKKRVEVDQSRVVVPDSVNNDSIVSYTVEFQKPGTQMWIVFHGTGPYLLVPRDAYGPQGPVRCVFTEIIAVDRNGRKYRQPDMVYSGGVWVPLKTPKK